LMLLGLGAMGVLRRVMLLGLGAMGVLRRKQEWPLVGWRRAGFSSHGIQAASGLLPRVRFASHCTSSVR
jgi:hypothetical protein